MQHPHPARYQHIIGTADCIFSMLPQSPYSQITQSGPPLLAKRIKSRDAQTDEVIKDIHHPQPGRHQSEPGQTMRCASPPDNVRTARQESNPKPTLTRKLSSCTDLTDDLAGNSAPFLAVVTPGKNVVASPIGMPVIFLASWFSLINNIFVRLLLSGCHDDRTTLME